MADPVQLASRRCTRRPTTAPASPRTSSRSSLWVGAMVAYMLIQPLNRRALAAGRLRLADRAGGLAAGGGDRGCCRRRALMSRAALGARAADGAGGRARSASCCWSRLCFAAIVQWLNARFGAAGRILVLALLMLQLTSAGGTYPVQTSPGFFNAHPPLPADELRRRGAAPARSRAAASARCGRRARCCWPSPRARSR